MADARHPARSPAAGWALMAVGLAVSAMLILFGPALAMQAPIDSEAGMTALIYAVIFTPMALVGLLFARVEGFSALRAGQVPGRWAAAGLTSGIAGFAIAAGLAALAGAVIAGQGAAPGGMILAGGLLILFQTGSEELFFRGWLFKALENRLGGPNSAWAAIGISALLFTGFHVLGGARTPMSLLNLLLGGLWFGLLAWRSGGLVAPLLAHFGWNASEELIAGLTPNPGSGIFGALTDWDLVGNPLWGGSEEGLNTSLGMAAVLIALIVPLAWRPVARGIRYPAIPDT